MQCIIDLNETYIEAQVPYYAEQVDEHRIVIQ